MSDAAMAAVKAASCAICTVDA